MGRDGEEGGRDGRETYKTVSLPGEWNGVMKRKGGGGGAQGRALGPVIKLSEQGGKEEKKEEWKGGTEGQRVTAQRRAPEKTASEPSNRGAETRARSRRRRASCVSLVLRQ